MVVFCLWGKLAVSTHVAEWNITSDNIQNSLQQLKLKEISPALERESQSDVKSRHAWRDQKLQVELKSIQTQSMLSKGTCARPPNRNTSASDTVSTSMSSS